jgi:hypothetical protein
LGKMNKKTAGEKLSSGVWSVFPYGQ